MNPTLKKTLIASSIAMALGAPAAQAVLVNDLYGPYNFSTDSANFTMLNSAGGYTMGPDGGANNVLMFWDGNGYSASSDYIGPGSAGNVTASTSDTFFGASWVAHDIQVFVPGTYSFDTTLSTIAAPNGSNGEAGILTATVGSGQLGMHMLFDWSGNNNIDVFVVASPGKVFGAGIGRSQVTSALGPSTNRCDNAGVTNPIKNCLFDGKPTGSAGKPLGSKVWMLASVDGDGDGIMGIKMAPGGPFASFQANFNASLASTPDAVVPVPAAVWLFGSGLMGLAAVARRKKKA
jgi:energy-converting hydrogenase Eha subunit B